MSILSLPDDVLFNITHHLAVSDLRIFEGACQHIQRLIKNNRRLIRAITTHNVFEYVGWGLIHRYDPHDHRKPFALAAALHDVEYRQRTDDIVMLDAFTSDVVRVNRKTLFAQLNHASYSSNLSDWEHMSRTVVRSLGPSKEYRNLDRWRHRTNQTFPKLGNIASNGVGHICTTSVRVQGGIIYAFSCRTSEAYRTSGEIVEVRGTTTNRIRYARMNNALVDLERMAAVRSMAVVEPRTQIVLAARVCNRLFGLLALDISRREHVGTDSQKRAFHAVNAVLSKTELEYEDIDWLPGNGSNPMLVCSALVLYEIHIMHFGTLLGEFVCIRRIAPQDLELCTIASFKCDRTYGRVFVHGRDGHRTDGVAMFVPGGKQRVIHHCVPWEPSDAYPLCWSMCVARGHMMLAYGTERSVIARNRANVVYVLVFT